MRNDETKRDQLDWFLHLLRHLGWAGTDSRRVDRLGKGAGRFRGARCCPLLLPGGEPVLAVAVQDALPPMTDVFAGFEDLHADHLGLARALHDADLRARHLVLLGERGDAQLLDLSQEEVLVQTSDRDATVESLLPLFEAGALMRGSIATLGGKPPARRAQELNRWWRLWTTRVGGALDASRDVVELLFEWLMLMRVCEPAGEPTEFATFAIDATAPSPERWLRSRWKRLTTSTNVLQGDAADAVHLLVKRAPEDLLRELLAHFACLGRCRFAAEIFAEAFADEELRTLSWRENLLALPDPPPEEGAAPRPARVELDREGYSLLLRQFDRQVEALRLQRQGLLQDRARGELGGLQLDAFGVEPPVEMPEDNYPGFVLERLIEATTTDPKRAALGRLILLARACEWSRRLEAGPVQLPRLAGRSIVWQRPVVAAAPAFLRSGAASNN